MKSFVVTRPLTDEALLSRSLLKEAIAAFAAMKDFIGFLNRALE
ncbi:MAG TPA: hypothetical protein VGR89_12395 [Puia sp.]|nr:hypothetical protein [Puia sp.]